MNIGLKASSASSIGLSRSLSIEFSSGEKGRKGRVRRHLTARSESSSAAEEGAHEHEGGGVRREGKGRHPRRDGVHNGHAPKIVLFPLSFGCEASNKRPEEDRSIWKGEPERLSPNSGIASNYDCSSSPRLARPGVSECEKLTQTLLKRSKSTFAGALNKPSHLLAWP